MSRLYPFAYSLQRKKNILHWKIHEPVTWDEFVEWLDLKNPGDRKECGGYVGGLLQETKGHAGDPNCVALHRNNEAVVYKSFVTLDADAASQSFTLDLRMELPGVAAALYTTWSSTPEAPRWRVALPLSEDVKSEDYRLIVQALMHDLGADQFDRGSSEPARVMWRPSTQGSYYSHVWEGEPLDPEVWLARAEELGFSKPEEKEWEEADTSVYDELPLDLKAEADAYVERVVDHWRQVYAEIVDWPEKARDEEGRGWDELALQGAFALSRLALAPWNNLDELTAEFMYTEILPAEIEEACPGKWRNNQMEKARSYGPPNDPPWVDRTSAEDDFAVVRRVQLPPCDATNESHVTRWLIDEVGHGPLSGLFRRGDEDLIYTPRVGEEGYEPPKNPEDHDGPAQVRRMTPLRLASRVDGSYRVFKSTKKDVVDVVFRRDLAERVMADLDRCKNLQRVTMVSHTPLMRADGTVLDQPGFDVASRVLYLPEEGLEVDPVPDSPSAEERAAAREVLLAPFVDFPFVSDHDRANYLGCLILPLLRKMVPPPYQMLIIGAPQRGSGKSLLAEIIRVVHGGVLRSEIPDGEDERRKVITSILDGTSAPVVQFDNVSGVLKSSTMDGLLTTAVWSDRRLGGNENVIVPNDRLWVVTGNNVMIGGDMDRRVLWSTINANLEHPELRPPSQFQHRLPDWVKDHRGEMIHAMLTLARAWVAAGSPVKEAPTSDSFGKMHQVLRGIMAHAGIAGEVGHKESKPDRPDLEAEEWSRFLTAVYRVFGDEEWTTRELMNQVSEFADEEGLEPDDLPGGLADKMKHAPHSVTKSLGKMLSSRQGQWAAGLKVDRVPTKGKHAVKWVVTDEI